MRHDLSVEQWHAVEDGVLTAPDGTSFMRRTSRAKRRDASELVEGGCPVVTYWPGGLPEKTQLLWHDGEDAQLAFAEVKSALTSDPPEPRKGACATAGRWETVDGDALLVVTWHH
jgi:hypothetical protein